DKKYPCNSTRAEFIKSISNIDGLDVLKVLTKTFEKELWHIIYSVKDKNQYVVALETFAKKKDLDVSAFLENFKNFKPYDSAYGAYSEKAIKKLLPLMRRGKYWDDKSISIKIKQRIDSIVDRIQSVDFDIEKIE